MRTEVNKLSSLCHHMWASKTIIPVEQAGASQPGLHCEQSPAALSQVPAQPFLHCHSQFSPKSPSAHP